MTPKQFAPLVTLLLAALMLAGCGGGGGGEPTVTQTIHDELQAELDAALATLETERAAKARAEEARAAAVTARMSADEARATAETERDTAKAAQLAAEAAKMEAEAAQAEAEADEAEALAAQLAAEAQLATALDDKAAVEADRDEKRKDATAAAIELIEVKAARDAAQAQVTRLTGELEDANDEVTDLTGERDTANTEVTRLTGELTTARAEVTRLTGVIGDETDSANAAESASLYAQLNAAKAEVATLTARVGSETDASSLTGMLEAAKAEVTRLTGLLTTANAEVTRLEGVIGDATQPTSLTARLAAAQAQVTTLQGRLRVSQDEVASLRRQLQDAQGELVTERDRADDAEDRANEATREVGTLEANRLSEGLLAALEGNYGESALPSAIPTDLNLATSPVTIQSPARGTTAIRFTRDGGYTVSSFTTPTGYTGKKFTRGDSRKETIVVITDRESSRKMLDHHFLQREGTGADAAAIARSRRSATRLVVGTGGIFNSDLANIDAPGSNIKIDHRFPDTYTIATSGDNERTEDIDEFTGNAQKRATSYSGRVYPATVRGTTSYKVSGRFECIPAPGCRVELASDYSDAADADGKVSLETVELRVRDKDGGDITNSALYFTPTSGAVPLDGSIETAVVDSEYMTFGYWLTERETSGVYTYQVFGVSQGAMPGTFSSPNVEASFSGTAVGVYVEQGGTAADLSKRQGQFTASVTLTKNTANTNLGGEIYSFQTTPAGGSTAPVTSGWLVDLDEAAPTGGEATIKNVAGSASSEGRWQYSLVGNHANVDPNDDPSAAVGVFDTRIPDRLHLSGAFGAKRD